MPLPAMIAVTIAVIGSTAYFGNQIRLMRRRKRNLEHWKKDEPLEGGVGDWD